MVSDTCNPTNPCDPVLRPFVDFWSNYAREIDDSAREYLGMFDGGEKLKTCQRRWLDTVSKSIDAYMRSPSFLQTMKQNTEMSIKAKRQFQDLAAEVARNVNIPTAMDISGLFERLHSIEETILARLGRVEERLAAIERQSGICQTSNV